MNFLKIDNRKAYFILEEEEIEPEKISKDDLMMILDIVFENQESIIFPNDKDFESIINPIEREIVEQISSKIKEFHTNIPHIITEINNKFPNLNHLVSNE